MGWVGSWRNSHVLRIALFSVFGVWCARATCRTVRGAGRVFGTPGKWGEIRSQNGGSWCILLCVRINWQNDVIGSGFPGGPVAKNPLANVGDAREWVRSLGQEDPLEKGMATHSSVLAWGIPWTVEPGGLQSTASQKSWAELSDWAHAVITDNAPSSPFPMGHVPLCLF